MLQMWKSRNTIYCVMNIQHNKQKNNNMYQLSKIWSIAVIFHKLKVVSFIRIYVSHHNIIFT